MTANDSKKNVVEGFDAGANDYLTKPFNDGELRARIRAGERLIELQNELRRSKNEVMELVENSPDIIVRFGKNLQFSYVNNAFLQLLNLSRQEVVGRTLAEDLGIDQTVRQIYSEKICEVLETGISGTLEILFTFAGRSVYLQTSFTPEFDFGGKIQSVLTIGRDITDQKISEDKVRRSELHYRSLVEFGQGYVLTYDRSGIVFSINQSAAKALGYDCEEITGRNIFDFVNSSQQEILRRQIENTWSESSESGLMFLSTKNGEEKIWKFKNIILTETVDTPLILSNAHDITDMHETERQLNTLSITDDLTGLYNRRGFLTLAEERIQTAQAGDDSDELFIIFADIDGLKQINDTYGHDEGSSAIKKVAELLSKSFRNSDIIARLGGDEFVILVANAGYGTREIIINRIEKNIAGYNVRKNHPYEISVSLGAVPIEFNGSKVTVDEFLREADSLMYQQKRKKKESYKNM